MEDLAKHFIEEEPRGASATWPASRSPSRADGGRSHWACCWAVRCSGACSASRTTICAAGLCYAAAIATAGAVHAMGHVQSARMVEAPMDTLLVTPIRTYTLYDDTGETITEDQHRGRAIGGPAANFAVGLGATLLSLLVKSRYLRFFGFFSILVGLGSLVPVAGNDGEELFRHKHG